MTLRDIRSAHPAWRGVAGAARLAKAVGGRCSAATIRRWECGEMVPEHAEARLCALLGLLGDQRRDVMAATRAQFHRRDTAFPRGGKRGMEAGPPVPRRARGGRGAASAQRQGGGA
jgi:hypothetical protein